MRASQASGGVDQIIERLGELASEMQQAGPSDLATAVSDKVPAYCFTEKSQCLGGSFASDFRAIVNRLASHKRIAPRFCRRSIERYCWTYLRNTVDPESRAVDASFTARAKSATKELRHALLGTPIKRWEVFLSVEGFAETEDNNWTFGGVRFLSPQAALAELLPRVNAVLDKSMTTNKERQTARKHFCDPVRIALKGKVLAAVIVDSCDETAARDIAEPRLRLTLDCINFLASLKASRNMYAVFPSGAGVPCHLAVPIFELPSDDRLSLPQFAPPPYQELHFRWLTTAPPEYVWSAADDLLEDPNPCQFAERLLTAIQWAGRAAIEHRPEEAFLWHAICLESLLLGPKYEGELTQRLALRAAHLLGTSLESKKEIKKEIMALYRVRSKIVHNGAYEVPEFDEQKIAAYGKCCIVRFLRPDLRDKFSSNQDLDTWFDDMLLQWTPPTPNV